ncbi:MAG: hypothetical protein ACJ74J_14720 [Blastocatellia bacterium]
MSRKTVDKTGPDSDAEMWAKLLEDIKAEDAADPNLTEEEKRFLEQMDHMSDDEWEPVTCEGEPISETIIKDRGERW